MGRTPATEYAQTIVETIAQPLLILDGTLRVETANPAFYTQFGTAPDATLGRRLAELGDGEWDIPALDRQLHGLLSGSGTLENFRVEKPVSGERPRIMLLNARPMNRGHAARRILLAISDVTERERLLFEIEGQREFDEKLIDSVRESLLILDWDLRVQSANKSFYDSFAVTPEQTTGRLVYELGSRQWDIPELRRLLEDILPRETTFDDFEVDHRFEGVGRRIMLLNARRIDHKNLILLAIRDVSEQRRQERRQMAFVGELQHRVKNILNNVRALARHTQRGRVGLEDFFEAFEARLGALARAQDLLVRGPSESVGLHDILTLELGAVGAREGLDYTIEGPPVRFPPQDAQAVAMTIHELATNAAKYGALAAAGGHIEAGWQTERHEDAEILRFHWRERGVRIEDADPPRGFGSRVIRECLPHMMGGTAELLFRPDGIICRLRFPLPDQDAV